MSRILRGSRRSGTGLAVQMMIGVPYATNVGFDGYALEAAGGLEIDREYSQELFELFQSKIETYMKLLEKYPDIKVVV